MADLKDRRKKKDGVRSRKPRLKQHVRMAETAKRHIHCFVIVGMLFSIL